MTQTLDNTKTDPKTGSRERPVRIGHLKHQFLWCFLTITLVTTGVGIALMIELVSGPRLTETVNPGNTVAFLAALRWRIVLGALLIIIATGVVYLFLYARIARPLEKVASGGELGDLLVLDAETGAVLHRFEGGRERVRSLASSTTEPQLIARGEDLRS